METELGTTANMNMYYINTAQITSIQSEFRNLTNPQVRNIPARIKVWNNKKWMDSAMSTRSTWGISHASSNLPTLQATKEAGEPTIVVHVTFQISRCCSCLCCCLDNCHCVPFPIESSIQHSPPDAAAFYLLFAKLSKTSRGLLWYTEQQESPSVLLQTQEWPFHREVVSVSFLSKPEVASKASFWSHALHPQKLITPLIVGGPAKVPWEQDIS